MTAGACHDELVDLILAMAAREDVHSVSCQFGGERLWRGLLAEQLRRVRRSGLAPRDAFFLCGPDAGILGIAKDYPGRQDGDSARAYDGSTLEEQLGGDIHIPLEGVCGADLFVYPHWRKVYPEAWAMDGAELDWATSNQSCNHLLIERDLGETALATRVGPIAGTWWLYSSTGPGRDCNPFHEDREQCLLRIRRGMRIQ
jgi:hypothetical protein